MRLSQQERQNITYVVGKFSNLCEAGRGLGEAERRVKRLKGRSYNLFLSEENQQLEEGPDVLFQCQTQIRFGFHLLGPGAWFDEIKFSTFAVFLCFPPKTKN